jgi:hypothetical protein
MNGERVNVDGLKLAYSMRVVFTRAPNIVKRLLWSNSKHRPTSVIKALKSTASPNWASPGEGLLGLVYFHLKFQKFSRFLITSNL